MHDHWRKPTTSSTNTNPTFDLSTFTFGEHTLRTVQIDGEPWFLGPDVCKALGLSKNGAGSYQSHYKRVESKSKKTLPTRIFGGYSGDLPGNLATFLSEAGMYTFVLRAQEANPAAKAFQEWVTKDVLPAIRKDGAYIQGEEKLPGTLNGSDLAARIDMMKGAMQEENKRLLEGLTCNPLRMFT